MHIRIEKPGDFAAVYQINIDAFKTDAEANLVEMLREEKIPLISLVAEDERGIVGHILFSPVVLLGKTTKKIFAGLGPMAVRPSHQKKGIGSKLITEGLKHCLDEGYDAVVVLGHQDYYPRFGFEPSMKFGITSKYDVPAELFMIKELKEGSLKGIKGTVTYHDLFEDIGC